MAGYWRRSDATREVLSPDGWLRTGDAARRDAEGYVWVVDRLADRFISNGRLVYPGDVERVLTGHPSVEDAAVVPIARGGSETVAALVIPSAGSTLTEHDILEYGRRHLAPHEIPTSVTFLNHLPRTSVGKLIRTQLTP